MTTTTAPPAPLTGTTRGALPRRRTLVVLASTYLVGFAAVILTAQDPDGIVDPKQVVEQMTMSENAVAWITFGGVALAAVLVFLGGALKSLLAARGRHWTTDVVGYGFAAMAFAVTLMAAVGLWLAKAVEDGDLGAIHTINVIDDGTFVFAMLGLCTAMLSVGLAGRATGALPAWLCWASIVLGVIAPIGPGGFAPFTLFPIWLVVVTALVRVPDAA